MKRLFLTVAFATFLTATQFAQTNNTAPVVWERYKVSDRNISFLFPKMPVVTEFPTICGEMASVMYLAYANGAIYEFVIAGPKRSATQVNCGGKIISHNPKKLDARLEEVRKLGKYKEERVKINEADVYLFSSKTMSRWIYPNTTTPAKWIEIAVSHQPNHKPDTDALTSSIVYAATEGKDVGKGSPVTLGDDGVSSSSAAASLNLLARTTSNLILYWQPRNTYTGEKFTGKVKLEITFLANGAIGKIFADKQLPYGLTEVAIASARRISFLPKRVNNLPVDDVQTIVYEFNSN